MTISVKTWYNKTEISACICDGACLPTAAPGRINVNLSFICTVTVSAVALLYLIAGKDSKKILLQILAWASAAVTKFAVLYSIVTWLICGVLADKLLAAGMLKQPMLKALPATFGLPQLFTALIGGAVALLICPVLKKALRRN